LAAVQYDPVTGMPKVRVMGPRSQPQIPYTEFGGGPGGTDYGWPNTSAPLFVGFPNNYRPGTFAPGGGSTTTTTRTGGGGGGFNIGDYRSMIENDPGYQALRAQLAAGNISAAQFRKSAIQRALIAFGRTPEAGSLGLGAEAQGYYSEDVDALTRDLAAKNTAEGLSTTAQLDRAHQMALSGLQSTLASRGMLESGSLGVGLGLEEQRNKGEVTGKTRELIDYLGGQAAAYSEKLQQSKLAEAQALRETTGQYMSMAGTLGFGGGTDGGGETTTTTTTPTPATNPQPQPTPQPAGWRPLGPNDPLPPLTTSYNGTTLAQARAGFVRAGYKGAKLTQMLRNWVNTMMRG
jgi:hypothetical protein